VFKVFLCLATEHNWWLVTVAALVCLPSTLATFFLYSKVPARKDWRRWTWLGMTGVVAGSGIWTTHFVAMLAFKTGLPTGYAALPTLGSLVVAVASTTLGFAIASGGTTPSRLRTTCGGLTVGLGITAMHYVGMLGYRTTGVLAWDVNYVAASVVVGSVFAAAAMALIRVGGQAWRRPAAAGLLSLGIVGMHFTGMTAVTILPDSGLPVPANLMSDEAMVIAAVAVTALILLTAIGGAALDAASRNGNLRRLREALDVMPEGLAFYDSEDRLVAWNTQYADLCHQAGATLDVGLLFTDLLKTSLRHGAYPEAVGREAEWLNERGAARWGGMPSLTQKTAAGRWFRITERRTADGGTVSVSVDITDLTRARDATALERDRAEELARRAEVAESIAGLGHWRLDAASRELTWSNQLYLIYGMTPDAPLDLAAVMAMTHADDMATSASRLDRQLLTGESDENSITRIVRASGEVRFLAGRSSVERGPDDAIVAVVGTVVDITDQKAAELAVARSEERFRRLAVNAPDLINETTLDGVMTYVSPASLAITGFTPEELVGKNSFSLMEPEDAAKVREMCKTVFASKGHVRPWSVEFRARHKDGRELWLECKPTPAIDPATGRYTGLNDIIRDITPRKVLEAKLRLAQAQAEAAANVKADFLANMSHELRTPLTSIIGFTGLATEQADLSELTRDYIDRVGHASRALLCTVNDILDFSKLEAGQVTIQPQPVRLAGLGRAALDLFTPQAGAKDLSLTLDCGPGGDDLVLAIDPDRIRQILLNLVSNAVKFTATGGVTLQTRYDETAGRLRVEVADTGAGIPAEKLGCLFQRFSQIDGSLTRAQSGTGLGLAICKGLVEAMGGEVGVESQVGEGSRFWFEIPAATASLAAAGEDGFGEAAAGAQIAFAGVRVLVADDNQANRELARLYLAGVGAEISEAENGEQAAEMAMELPYDVILMDIRMPILDGPAALRKIRERSGPNDATPILAFTADAEAGARKRLMAMGFDGVVAKPLEPGPLLALVAHATAFVERFEDTRHAD
jgi:PAS domain S-box-containing protein